MKFKGNSENIQRKFREYSKEIQRIFKGNSENIQRKYREHSKQTMIISNKSLAILYNFISEQPTEQQKNLLEQ
jgi:hypothetical protein